MKAYKKHHRFSWSTIKLAVTMYNSKTTYREVAAKLEKKGVDVSHKTVFEWVKKFKKESNLKQKRISNLIKK